MELHEQIFQAIDTIVNERLNSVQFDTTVRGTIVSKLEETENEYRVQIDSTIYTALASADAEYKKDDVVYVTIPRGDYTVKEKIIIGKYESKSTEAVLYEDPFSRLVTNFAIDTNDLETVVLQLNNDIGTYASVEYAVEPDWFLSSKSDLGKYDYIGLKTNLLTNWPSGQEKNSSYYLMVTLLDENKQPLHMLDEKLGLTSLLLTEADIYGNPYSMQVDSTDFIKLWNFPAEIEDPTAIKYIQLTVASSDGFNLIEEVNLEETEDETPSPDDEVSAQAEETKWISESIEFKNFRLYFGYDVDQYGGDDRLILRSQTGTTEYNNTNIEGYPISAWSLMPDGSNVLLESDLGKTDGAGDWVVRNDEMQTPGAYQLRWYIFDYDIGTEYCDEIGGTNWRVLPTDFKSMLLPSTAYLFKQQSQNTQIKAVLCEYVPKAEVKEGDTEPNEWKIIKTGFITFTNLTLDRTQDFSSEVLQLNGDAHHSLYNYNGKQLNANGYSFQLTASFKGLQAPPTDLIGDETLGNSKVTWEILEPDTNQIAKITEYNSEALGLIKKAIEYAQLDKFQALVPDEDSEDKALNLLEKQIQWFKDNYQDGLDLSNPDTDRAKKLNNLMATLIQLATKDTIRASHSYLTEDQFCWIYDTTGAGRGLVNALNVIIPLVTGSNSLELYADYLTTGVIPSFIQICSESLNHLYDLFGTETCIHMPFVLPTDGNWSSTIQFTPRDTFDPLWGGVNNRIKCTLTGSVNSYSVIYSTTFSYIGTQGTKYSFYIQPIEETGKPLWLSHEVGAKQKFAAILKDLEGNDIPIDENKISWSWKQKTEDYVVNISTGAPYRELEDELNISFNTSSEEIISGKKYIIYKNASGQIIGRTYEGPYITQRLLENSNNAKIELTLQRLFGFKYRLKDTDTGYREKLKVTQPNPDKNTLGSVLCQNARQPNVHILQATYTIPMSYSDNGRQGETVETKLVALYPIVVCHPLVDSFKGNAYMLWDEQNNLIYPIAKPLEGAPSYTVLGDDFSVTLKEAKQGEMGLTTNDSNMASYLSELIDTDDDLLATKRLWIKAPEQNFCYNAAIAITCYSTEDRTFVDPRVYFSRPILVEINTHSVDVANDWSGAGVWIDNARGSILTTQIGAGKKDPATNKFTGVFMGDVAHNYGTKVITGLFAQHEGVTTFLVNTEGEVQIKQNENNQLVFNQTEGFKLRANNFGLKANNNNFVISSQGEGYNSKNYYFLVKNNTDIIFGIDTNGNLTVKGDITATTLNVGSATNYLKFTNQGFDMKFTSSNSDQASLAFTASGGLTIAGKGYSIGGNDGAFKITAGDLLIDTNAGTLTINADNFTLDSDGNVTLAGALTAQAGSQIGNWLVINGGCLQTKIVSNAATQKLFAIEYDGGTLTNEPNTETRFKIQANGIWEMQRTVRSKRAVYSDTADDWDILTTYKAGLSHTMSVRVPYWSLTAHVDADKNFYTLSNASGLQLSGQATITKTSGDQQTHNTYLQIYNDAASNSAGFLFKPDKDANTTFGRLFIIAGSSAESTQSESELYLVAGNYDQAPQSTSYASVLRIGRMKGTKDSGGTSSATGDSYILGSARRMSFLVTGTDGPILKIGYSKDGTNLSYGLEIDASSVNVIKNGKSTSL